MLTEAISWHWIFFVNLPIGIATAVMASRLLERDRGIGLGHGADVPGAALITSSLMLGVYTIVEAADYGWGSAADADPRRDLDRCCSIGFVVREHRDRQPAGAAADLPLPQRLRGQRRSRS